MPIFAPIQNVQNGMDAFLEGASKAQGIFDSLVRNKNLAAQTAAQEAKNPYIGPQSAADLQNQLNINKYYAPNIQSEIGARNASAGLSRADAQLKNQLFQNPGLGGTGVEHEQAVLSLLLQKHPELANQLSNEVKATSSQQVPSPDVSQNPMNLMQVAQQAMQPRQPISMTPMNAGSPHQGLPGMTPSPQQAPIQQSQPAISPNIQQSQSGFNPASALQKYIQAQIDEKNAMANWRNQGGGGLGVGGKEENTFRNIVSRDNPQLNGDPDKVYEATNVLKSGGDTLEDGTKLNPLSANAMDSLSRIAKNANTAAGLNQQRFANTLDTVFKHADQFAPAAFKFAGAAGKLSGGIEQLRSQVGDNDPGYQSYRTYVDQEVPAMITEITRTGGANSTDKQKAIALGQAITMNISTNPKLAEKEYNELKSLYRDIGKSVAKSTGKTQIDLRNQDVDQSSSPPETGKTDWVRGSDGKLVRSS